MRRCRSVANVGVKPIAVVDAPIMHERRHHDRLAPDAVAEVREDHAAQRPGREPDGKHAKAGDGAGQRAQRRKEQAVERQRRQEAVDQEVVPLDRRAEEARRQHAPVRHADRRGDVADMNPGVRVSIAISTSQSNDDVHQDRHGRLQGVAQRGARARRASPPGRPRSRATAPGPRNRCRAPRCRSAPSG